MPPFDYDALESQRRAEIARQPLPSAAPAPREDEPLGFWSAAGDVLLSPVRGVLGAGQGILGLADSLAFDLIPDAVHQTKLLGPSKTIVGAFGEGAAQFLTGFIPGLKVAQGIGALAKLGRFSTVARGAAAGAVADFAVFQGNEQRLSNLVEMVPGLRNPVTAFLAAEEDDPEILGRIKNVVEGGLAGAAIDGVLHGLGFGLRRIKAARKVRTARPDLPADQVAAEVDRLVPVTPEVQGALDEALVPADDPLVTIAQKQETLVTVPGGSVADDPETLARFLAADERGVQTILDAFHARESLPNQVNPRNLDPTERLAAGLQAADINLDHFQGEEGAFQLWRAFEGLTRQQGQLVAGNVKRTVQEQELANLKALRGIVGEGEEGNTLARLTAQARKLGEAQVDMTARIGALNMVAQQYMGEAYKTIQKIKAGTAGDIDQARFAQHLGTLADLFNVVKGFGSEQGRGLRMRRETVTLLDPTELRDVITEFGGSGRIKELAERVETLWNKGGSPHQVVEFLNASPRLAATQEWWIGSMLSRVSTSAVDLTSAVGFAAYRPLNAIVGGLLTGSKEGVRSGVHQLTYFASGWADAMRAWGRTFRTKQNLLDAHAISRAADLGAGQSRSALAPAALGVDPASAGGRVLSGMAAFTQTVFGVLKSNEEFVKTLVTHSYGKAMLMEDAVSKGLVGDQVTAAVESQFKNLVRGGQLLSRRVLFNEGLDNVRAQGGLTTGFEAVDKANRHADAVLSQPEMHRLSVVSEAVRERAREVTFTRRAADQDVFGKVSRTIQEIRNRHPLARFVMPFVNTPINIIQTGFQQVDAYGPIRYAMAKAFSESRFLGAATLEGSRNRFIREMMSGDPAQRADAVGRVFMGLGAMTTFGSLALAGTITGKGPEDPALRRQLRNSGWQPYSIRIGDTYISYARIEPVATVISLAADAMQASKWLPPEDQGGVSQAVLAGALSVVNQTTNKTFLKGLSDFMDVISEPERFATEYVAGFISTAAVPGAVQQFVPATDAHFREARGVVDRVLARVPGLSSQAPAMRNVLGEPISNGTVFQDVGGFFGQRWTTTSDDLITRELAGLGGFYPPSSRRLGVDLRDVPLGSSTAYDRFSELHGQVKLGGKTLRRALRDLIGSASYQRLPAEGTDLEDSPRRAVLNRVLSSYRRASWYRLLEEAPELQARQQQAQLDRRNLFAGAEGDFSTDPEGFLSR